MRTTTAKEAGKSIAVFLSETLNEAHISGIRTVLLKGSRDSSRDEVLDNVIESLKADRADISVVHSRVSDNALSKAGAKLFKLAHNFGSDESGIVFATGFDWAASGDIMTFLENIRSSVPNGKWLCVAVSDKSTLKAAVLHSKGESIDTGRLVSSAFDLELVIAHIPADVDAETGSGRAGFLCDSIEAGSDEDILVRSLIASQDGDEAKKTLRHMGLCVERLKEGGLWDAGDSEDGGRRSIVRQFALLMAWMKHGSMGHTYKSYSEHGYTDGIWAAESMAKECGSVVSDSVMTRICALLMCERAEDISSTMKSDGISYEEAFSKIWSDAVSGVSADAVRQEREAILDIMGGEAPRAGSDTGPAEGGRLDVYVKAGGVMPVGAIRDCLELNTMAIAGGQDEDGRDLNMISLRGD